jgi:ferric-dicitrate binding protein FerR (iron transport regulator)
MEKKNYIRKIIEQYLSGRYARETEEKVQRWLIDETHAGEKNRSLEAYWDTIPEGVGKKTHASLAQLKARLGMDGEAAVIPRRRSWLRVAAVLLPVAFLTGSYFLLKNIPSRPDTVVNLSVPYGERKEVRLPDASTVFLNAGSSIHYPASFDGDTRRVRLSGEAYFSVTKDASRPFIVETEHLSVEVLGTEFNLKAYPDETRTVATLNSGSVRVETKTMQSYILTPNRQLVYNSRSKRTDLAEVNAGEASSWKDGHLIFDNMTLPEILPVIKRKFNVSILANQSPDSGSRYSIKFVHNESLQEVMKILGITCGFSFRIENNTVRLTKPGE